MFGKTLARITKSKQTGPKTMPETPGSTGVGIGKLSKMVNASGRIGLPLLQKICALCAKDDFIKFMQHPALVGSAIYSGKLSGRQKADPDEMNRTVLFEPEEAAGDMTSTSDSLKHAIYPLVKGEYATSSRDTFTIGRVDGNDMIMPDYAISKQHALITRQQNVFLIKDCGSTNGTTVDGQHLAKKPVALKAGSIISFARYEFTFMPPAELYEMLNRP